MQKHVSCFVAFVGFVSFYTTARGACTTTEMHRVLIENSAGGNISGSRDGGKNWIQLGNVTTPMNGDYWIPSQTGGVLAFDFLRGPSSVFASAVNNLHFRFSDPEGYTLPEDVNIRPIRGHGISIVPSNNLLPYAGASYAALTNIPGGTLIFGKEWSPRIGDAVYVNKNDGTGFAPIPYEFKMLPSMSLMYVTGAPSCEIESLVFENKVNGTVKLKRVGEEATIVARVTKPVQGIGRFEGSEFLQKPGTIRANHAGVFDIGTTDIALDKTIPPQSPIAELRGGFQVVPSFHFNDPSMANGRDHPYVYLVVAPYNQQGEIKRYDMGIEGSYPLLYQGVRAGMGQTFMKFKNDNTWYEMNQAVQLGKFKTGNGKIVKHLRGVIKDVFSNVTHIQYRFVDPKISQQ